jgi:3-hydroxyacyl-CoA dehydrogenase/enoyl-CoA hydratase/3-hydroxybutyryl-CoA epimerase
LRRGIVATLFSKETKILFGPSLFLLTMPPEENQTKGYDKVSFKKVGVIGAGMMMGAGLLM